MSKKAKDVDIAIIGGGHVKPPNLSNSDVAAGSGTFPGFTEEEHKEFKRLGRMRLGETTEKDFGRYKTLLHQTLEGFAKLLGDK